MTATPDEWFEYDCPNSNIDFDVRPVPAYGSRVECSACGGGHVANETIGRVYRLQADESLEDVTDTWVTSGDKSAARPHDRKNSHHSWLFNQRGTNA